MSEYEQQRRQSLHDLIDVAFTESGYSIGCRIFESVQRDGNWFVAEADHGRWQIAVSVSDGTTRWRKYERAYIPLEQVEGWEPEVRDV